MRLWNYTEQRIKLEWSSFGISHIWTSAQYEKIISATSLWAAYGCKDKTYVQIKSCSSSVVSTHMSHMYSCWWTNMLAAFFILTILMSPTLTIVNVFFVCGMDLMALKHPYNIQRWSGVRFIINHTWLNSYVIYSTTFIYIHSLFAGSFWKQNNWCKYDLWPYFFSK